MDEPKQQPVEDTFEPNNLPIEGEEGTITSSPENFDDKQDSFNSIICLKFSIATNLCRGLIIEKYFDISSS